MWRAGLVFAGGALFVCACSSDVKRDTGIDPDPDAGPDLDAELADALPEKDAGPFVVHDAGGPISCTITCDCPQGLACVDGACTALGTPVWCCDRPGCPSGQQCLDGSNRPDVCEGAPTPRDAGVRPDTGPGQIGDYCEADDECDQAQGLTCWERFSQPFIWGHCTLENCAFSTCPTGTQCIEFTGTGLTGCMVECNSDAECRSDAFCFPLPSAPFYGICIPDCRDDFYDCSPRDGSRYCNPSTGIFIPDCDVTPTHDANAIIGDPCLNSTQCAAGNICLGEFAWGFESGMCTQVCDGLDEAAPCPIGSSCQYLPPPNQGLGLCFRDCVGATCPDRPGATCSTLDPSWIDPSCVPPLVP